jgi:hypothetical protein
VKLPVPIQLLCSRARLVATSLWVNCKSRVCHSWGGKHGSLRTVHSDSGIVVVHAMHTRSINGPPDWVVHGTVRRAAGAGVNAFQRSATAVLALEDLTFSAQHSAARTVRSTVTQAGCYPAHNTRAERGRDRELHRADESSVAFDVPRPSRHQCGAGAFLSCVFHLLFITRRISLSLGPSRVIWIFRFWLSSAAATSLSPSPSSSVTRTWNRFI